ncbi:helix-hairpin-helix domain-containing protein [Halorussus vallis]|uniref:DUF7409 domain-containing protein n=1 Tax=Halorussus vallis TaxID=2953749 RepID=UPI00209FC9B8|nr:helix-hairpin-helix domain-containing protein [Halorussus vallis]USZ76250.1 helix-hairpin-helix domain-containing protein [Halorussus vallis]
MSEHAPDDENTNAAETPSSDAQASDDPRKSTDDLRSVTDIRFVGPATADVLAEADFDATGIAEKTISYEMLVDAGVNPGVATRLRREHSLHWSFGGDEDSLERRSSKVRGLQDEERAWVAASNGDWENADPEPTATATADGSGAAEAAEAAWRERSKPDPVTDVPGVDAEVAERLAEGGVTSVRSLATADPEHVADSLSLDHDRVVEWWKAARRLA